MSGETPDADHGTARADHQDERHLQQDFERIGDADRRAIHESLGAIAGLQDELAAFGSLGELLPQVEDFPTGDQRRQRTQFGEYPPDFGGVGILRLL